MGVDNQNGSPLCVVGGTRINKLNNRQTRTKDDSLLETLRSLKTDRKNNGTRFVDLLMDVHNPRVIRI